MRLKALRMPEDVRSELSEGAGIIVEGRDSGEIMLKTLHLLSECSIVIAVGDVVCRSLIHTGLLPDICVIDGRTLRRDVGDADVISEELFDEVVTVCNPPAHITVEAMNALKSAFSITRRGGRVLVKVKGEEDLLALYALTLAKRGECVVYGMPGKGVGVMTADDELKRYASKILSRFEEVSVTCSEWGRNDGL